MNKTLIDKLNPQDRIEYLLEKHDNNPIGVIILCFVMFITTTNLSLFLILVEGVEEGETVMYFGAAVFAILFFLALGIEASNNKKIEDKYADKLIRIGNLEEKNE